MPFIVKDPEFKGRTFASVWEYETAKKAVLKRENLDNLKAISIGREPEVLFIEAELKHASNRLTGVEVELREFRGQIERMLTEIQSSLKTLMVNKDGIPFMTKLKGVSTVKGEFPEGKIFELLVTTRGYEIKGQRYGSLSAAAEGVSGNRRNGWEWWKTEEGSTAAEAFRLQTQNQR